MKLIINFLIFNHFQFIIIILEVEDNTIDFFILNFDLNHLKKDNFWI